MELIFSWRGGACLDSLLGPDSFSATPPMFDFEGVGGGFQSLINISFTPMKQEPVLHVSRC